MQKLVRILCLISFLAGICLAQHTSHTVDQVLIPFKSFQYSEVISIADSILSQDSLLSETELIEINRMKAISHFSLGEELYARNCFYEILKIDPKFKLDPVQNSPKIIYFFNQVKLDYLQAQITLKDQTPVKQSIAPQKETFASNSEKSMKSAMIKSVLFPGWGHLYLNKKSHGVPLLIGSMLTLPPMIYYIFDCNQKEKTYLNETDHNLIQSKYDGYNQSYKIRNSFIAGFSMIWLYSQWDLFSESSNKQMITMQPNFSNDKQGHIRFTARFNYTF